MFRSIFITHLHGDHCFGLTTTLQMIDSAKADRAAAAGGPNQGGLAATSGASSSHSTGSSLGSILKRSRVLRAREASSAANSAASLSPSLKYDVGYEGGTSGIPVTHVFGPPGLGELLRVSLVLTGDQRSLRTRILVTELVLDNRDAQAPAPLGRDPAAVKGSQVALWKGATEPGPAAAQSPQLTLQRLGSLSVDADPELKVRAIQPEPCWCRGT